MKDAYDMYAALIIFGGFVQAAFLALSIWCDFDPADFMVWLDGDEFQHHVEYDVEEGQPVEPPTQSPPRRSDPLSPVVFPSAPVEFPFKHFRGTGDSFAPSSRYYNEERPPYTPPVLYKTTGFSEDTQNKEGGDIAVSEVSKDDESLLRIEIDSVESQTPASPIRAVQPPTQPRPLTQSPCIDGLTQSFMKMNIRTPPRSHDFTFIQAPPPSNPPSPKTGLIQALTYVAEQESKIQEHMSVFLDAITTGAEYKSSADMILRFLDDAKQYLMPLCPDGLSSLPLDYRIWKTSIISFWAALSPHGWAFNNHPDGEIREFIHKFRNFAIWVGLEEQLVEFQFNAPPPPEPVLAPTEVESQSQEQPNVTQISSSAIVPPETTQLTLPESTPIPSTPVIPPSASDSDIDMDGEAPSTPTPETPFEAVETPCPIRVQPAQQPNPASSAFTFTAAPVPISFTFEMGNAASKAPPRAPREPQSTKLVQKPKAAPEESNLLNFDDPELHNMPTEELKAITWSSFAWPSASQAAQKIWGYSMVGRLVLDDPGTEDLTSEYIKYCLENVASDFKRAAIILRLQARDCERPCEDDLGMAPLFGEVVTLLEQAADFTERCDELAVWDTQSQWYTACVFFRDAVREDEAVWETLCHHYGREKYEALEKAWKDGSAEWLLLDSC